MKKNEFLQDAIGLIDDSLIAEANAPVQEKRTLPQWAKWCAAAACLVLIVGGLFAILKLTMSPASTLPQLSETTNLWQQSDFDVYSLSYLPSGANPVSYQSGQAGVVLLGNETSQSGITSKSLSIILDKTIKFESLVAHRYAVYRSDTGYPVFYDTVENCQVDLQERILGDTDWIYLEFMAAAEKKAEELYPGILYSDTNRKLLWQYLYGIIQDMDLSGVVAQQPDTAFMDYLADKPDEDPEYRNTLFWDMCWAAYAYAETDLQGEMCCMQILAIDAVGGICIIRVQDVYGSGCQYLTYDITTDTCQELPDANNSLIGIMQSDGYIFRFSADSSIATVAFPKAGFYGANLYQPILNRYKIPSIDRNVMDYQGEQYGAFFLNGETAVKLNGALGSSELFVSEKNRVLYYKKMPEASSGKSFFASDSVWFNRLQLFNKDTDRWIFCSLANGSSISKEVELEGNFVRFAAEETIAIMERGGKYFAYSLESGKDVTDDILNGDISLYPHEQLLVYEENGSLYKRQLFSDQAPALISKADTYLLSSDGAFAFTYCADDGYILCWNTDTLECCRIDIDAQMLQQMRSAKGAVLQMNYNEEENTLLLSFYCDEDLDTSTQSDLDFYATLEELTNSYTDFVTITDYTVDESIMDAFRQLADDYEQLAGSFVFGYHYPPFLDRYDTRYTIFGKLGLEEPTEPLSVNGTHFVLYDKGDEKLILEFHKHWGLFDYSGYYPGLLIWYYYGDETLQVAFDSPKEKEDPQTQIPLPELPVEIPPREKAS